MYEKEDGDRNRFAAISLEYAEKNKARQFAETWGRTFQNEMRSSLPPVIQQREQQLFAKRDALTAKIDGASADETPKPQLERELASTQGDITKLVSELRKISPQYAAVAYPEEIRLSALPLRKSETLLEFKMTDDSTFVWIVRNSDGHHNELVEFYEIPRKRTWFLERLSQIRNALNSGQPYAIDWTVSEELFHALFPGKAETSILEQSDEIVLIPDDALFILPFELLSPTASKGTYFFLRKPITYYPSAVSLTLRRDMISSHNWQSSLLGIADPITSPDDERYEATRGLSGRESKINPEQAAPDGGDRGPSERRLKSRGFTFERIPGTAVELQSIVALMKQQSLPADVRFGVDATKTELLDTDLAKYRFIHFATHGVLPVDTGIQEPSLVLSYDGVTPDDMFLSMSEILKLKLQSESVVLSACNTGSGKISKAEGVMSLGRAFLAAGSASVTVSLWQVSDESTAILMTKYYQSILDGKKKSVALARARSAVFEAGSKNQNPFFWSPFIIIGE
jgi:CHAT domain-containing protein